MLLNEYQDAATQTAVYPDAYGLFYTALGAAEEAGEICGQMKRVIRDDECVIKDDRRDKLRMECGDLLWYVSQIARHLGCTLEDVAKSNLRKLQERQSRDALKGKGDTR